MKIKNVIDYLEEIYPMINASEFDVGKIGLQIGDENIKLTGVLLSLDLNYEVVKEAIDNQVNLIVTHHPFIFNPLTNILFNTPNGQIIELMFKHKISLYVMHTNLDVGFLGVNDSLAQRLGFINYEPSFDNALRNNFIRCGYIQKKSLHEYAKEVQKKLSLTGLRVAGKLNKTINKVAVIGGSGGQIEEIERTIALECDCLITGEVSLHIAQYALERNLAIIEVPHGVEKFVFSNLSQRLKSKFNHLTIFISKENTDPFIYFSV